MKLSRLIIMLFVLFAIAFAFAVPQTKCPVCGMDINKNFYFDVGSKRVYFAHEGCIDTFRKNMNEYMAQMNKDGVELENIPGFVPPSQEQSIEKPVQTPKDLGPLSKAANPTTTQNYVPPVTLGTPEATSGAGVTAGHPCAMAKAEATGKSGSCCSSAKGTEKGALEKGKGCSASGCTCKHADGTKCDCTCKDASGKCTGLHKDGTKCDGKACQNCTKDGKTCTAEKKDSKGCSGTDGKGCASKDGKPCDKCLSKGGKGCSKMTGTETGTPDSTSVHKCSHDNNNKGE